MSKYPCVIPPKRFPVEDLSPRLIHGFWDPTESIIQTASQSVQPFLQGSRLCPTDIQRHTDHATSVTIDRILC